MWPCQGNYDILLHLLGGVGGKIEVVFVYGDRKEYVGDLRFQKPILKAIGVNLSCSFAECFFRLRSNEREKSQEMGNEVAWRFNLDDL